MIVGQYVHKGGGVAVYSPSFPRGGLGAIFTASILQVLGSPTLSLAIEHKNIEDTSWTTLGTIAGITSTGQQTSDQSAIKEILRFKYTITATNDWEGFLINMTAPAWRPYA